MPICNNKLLAQKGNPRGGFAIRDCQTDSMIWKQLVYAIKRNTLLSCKCQERSGEDKNTDVLQVCPQVDSLVSVVSTLAPTKWLARNR